MLSAIIPITTERLSDLFNQQDSHGMGYPASEWEQAKNE